LATVCTTACALVAAVTPEAGAATLAAKGVLPPGQSGYVSVTGLASGTGSPHLTDQIELYETFGYRSIQFDRPGTTESPRPGVEITRDAYGVPQITGQSEYDGWWGVGYAVAQDRLFQLDLFRRATSGRLAEILGPGYLDDDLIARRDYYTDAEVDAMLADLPARLQDRTQAYADGINAWIDHVTANPSEMPGEFVALGDLPIEEWTPRDSARVGIFLARTVPSSDGVELQNALALQEIGGRDFRRLLPLRTPGARATIGPGQGAAFPSQPGRSRADERRGWKRSKRFVSRLDLDSVVDTATQVPRAAHASRRAPGADLRRILPSPGGSFMWAIGDREADRAYLYNGPQLGYSIPELFVEWELHSPRFPNIRGVSAAGVPVMGIGHNGRVAWGFTSGLSDEDDQFVERVTGPETYRFRGAERQMDCRDEVFTWKTPPTDLPDALQELIGDGSGDPPAGSTTERICRTVHGPVQQTGDGIALSRRYAIWGRELETILGIDALNRARSVRDVNRAMRKVTWNENVIAADSRGHIGYWHPGLHPLRSTRWDERLPFPGTGRAEWRGLLPRGRTPQVIDPPQGWLANWNNVPSRGWTNGDSEARERVSGPFHRVRILERLVARVARNPSFARSTAIVRTSGTTAQQRPFVSERRLRAARRSAGPGGRRVLRAILRWDGNYDREDSEGTVDPGVAAWEEFKAQMQRVLLAPMGSGDGGAEALAGRTGSSHQFDISNGEAVARRTLPVRAWSRAAKRAARELTERFAGGTIEAWREPRRMYEVAAQGAGSSPDIEFFDRGTWNQSIAVGRR
jgi:penicillin G amidase